MPNPAYAKIKINGTDIPGEITSPGKEGMIEVLELHHEVAAQTDRSTGRPVGSRVHHPIRLIKMPDKTSPKLYEALNFNSDVELEIHWFRASQDGTMENYFKTSVQGGRISSVKLYLPYTRDPSKERYTELEEVSVHYHSINWSHVLDSVEHTDTGFHDR
jgi:type VI secretion system secreted protein Hcp